MKLSKKKWRLGTECVLRVTCHSRTPLRITMQIDWKKKKRLMELRERIQKARKNKNDFSALDDMEWVADELNEAYNTIELMEKQRIERG